MVDVLQLVKPWTDISMRQQLEVCISTQTSFTCIHTTFNKQWTKAWSCLQSIATMGRSTRQPYNVAARCLVRTSVAMSTFVEDSRSSWKSGRAMWIDWWSFPSFSFGCCCSDTVSARDPYTCCAPCPDDTRSIWYVPLSTCRDGFWSRCLIAHWMPT